MRARAAVGTAILLGLVFAGEARAACSEATTDPGRYSAEVRRTPAEHTVVACHRPTGRVRTIARVLPRTRDGARRDSEIRDAAAGGGVVAWSVVRFGRGIEVVTATVGGRRLGRHRVGPVRRGGGLVAVTASGRVAWTVGGYPVARRRIVVERVRGGVATVARGRVAALDAVGATTLRWWSESGVFRLVDLAPPRLDGDRCPVRPGYAEVARSSRVVVRLAVVPIDGATTDSRRSFRACLRGSGRDVRLADAQKLAGHGSWLDLVSVRGTRVALRRRRVDRYNGVVGTTQETFEVGRRRARRV